MARHSAHSIGPYAVPLITADVFNATVESQNPMAVLCFHRWQRASRHARLEFEKLHWPAGLLVALDLDADANIFPHNIFQQLNLKVVPSILMFHGSVTKPRVYKGRLEAAKIQKSLNRASRRKRAEL